MTRATKLKLIGSRAVAEPDLELLARLRALPRRARVALVGCAKQKRPGRHAARDLYVSGLFRASLGYAERTGDLVLVASARHGLVGLDQPLEAYDDSLGTRSRAERFAWGRQAVEGLVQRLPNVNVELVLLCGAVYADPLVIAAGQLARHWTVSEPLGGLGIGHRLRWLGERRVAG